jgi:hypothetical protein
MHALWAVRTGGVERIVPTLPRMHALWAVRTGGVERIVRPSCVSAFASYGHAAGLALSSNRRRDRDERAGQGLGVHGAPAGRRGYLSRMGALDQRTKAAWLDIPGASAIQPSRQARCP